MNHNDIKSAIDELGSTIKSFQDQNDLLEKKYDGITKEQADRLEKMATDMAASLQEQQQIKAALNRPGLAAQDEKAEKDAKNKEIKEAFSTWLRTRDPEAKKAYKELCTKDIVTNVNPDGGYLLLPNEMANFVSQRVFETSPIRLLANIETGSSASLEVVVDDNEAGAEWEGEGDTFGNTDTPEVGRVTITAHKLAAKPKISHEALEDSMLDVAAWLQRKLSDKFARTENTAFVTGNGVGRPRGFTTFAAWAAAGTYERGKIEQVNSGSSGAVTSDGLIELQNSLKEAYQGNARFVMKRGTFGDVMKLKNSQNDYYLIGMDFGSKSGMAGMTILGKPVVFFDDMPAVGSNALAIAYGDFQQGYTIYDKVGLNILPDPYSSDGFVQYKTYKRTGGHVTNFEAIKLQKLAN